MCLQNRCYVLYSCPLASILGALFMPFTSSCLLFLCLLPALTTESTLGFWRGRKILFSKCTYWFSIPMESLTLYFLHSTSPPPPPYYGCQTCTFTWDTRNNKSGGGEPTAIRVFLSKSPFSSPWIPPRSEPGLWDPQWTKTEGRTGCTFSLHLQHYSHRGLRTSSPCTNPMNFSSLAHSNAAILT